MDLSRITAAEALALLDWQVALGADEAIGDAPVDRFAPPPRPDPIPGFAEVRAPDPAADPSNVDPVLAARAAAGAASDLAGLEAALGAFALCELKRGARRTVFADGDPGAPVMIVGEAPGREEDEQGRPFVGQAGRLLDAMFAAIGLSRRGDPAPLYITNVLPWRPPSNREPTPEEIAMLLPFLQRHVELAAPEVIVAMGNTPAQALLGRRGITRLRGRWAEALGRPCLPMFHPAYLLRSPHAKREAWADLLSLQDRLEAP